MPDFTAPLRLRLVLLPFLAGTLLCVTPPTRAEDKPQKTDTATPTEATAAAPSNPLANFGRSIPEGIKNMGVWMPTFGETGKTMEMQAESVTRVDPNRLIIENLQLQLFGQPTTEDDDVTITIPSATYHMTNQILRSATRSTITRSDFEIAGDSMIYDTMTGQGRMVGNVRAVIRNAAAFIKPPEADSDKKAPTQQPSPENPVPSTSQDQPDATQPAATAPSPPSPSTVKALASPTTPSR
ncbi:MAG: hypothetical protein KDK99_07790 [Verrucomicrobiales bacterium]|nr:hypothetical protein [Verrucomicrobiales bacterium]